MNISESQECYWNSYWDQTPSGKKTHLQKWYKILLNRQIIIIMVLVLFRISVIQQVIILFSKGS